MSAAVRAFGYELLAAVADLDGTKVRLVLDEDMQCLRCGSHGILVVGLNDKAWEDIPLCIASCDVNEPWNCPKCDGSEVPEHTRWCRTAYPEEWGIWEAQLPGHKAIVALLLPKAANVKELRKKANEAARASRRGSRKAVRP